MKLAILGGGGFRTPYVWQALLRDHGNPRVTQVSLYDVDEYRLRTMENILQLFAADFEDAPQLTATTQLETALEGADFIFAAIRVGGLEARCCDEHVALEQGVLGQETTGPGGLAYAIRTIPAMMQIAQKVKQIAPNAYFINFTNPAGIITEAMQQVLGNKVLGICDTPSGLGRRVAGALELDHTRAQMDYVGLNHLGWMRHVIIDGQDVLPDLLENDELLSRMEEAKIFGSDWLRELGSLPNEYLYYYYDDRDAVRRILESPQTRGDFLLQTQTKFYQAASSAGSKAADMWWHAVNERSASYMAEALGGVQGHPTGHRELNLDPAHLGYAGVALGVMTAISRNERNIMILNVRNGHTVTNMPEDAVVEVPTMVDSNGVHPLSMAEQPNLHQIGLMQQVKAVERHAIAAAMTGSSDEALKAFAFHPLVESIPIAHKLLEGYTARIPGVAQALDSQGIRL
ncbi:6-phospho-beta-glucosidase [Bombiscardovia nodaiensis]|uniref:6-phospho-beta-glucosidase n=1 Tax=Bombiscardovia nodaiensis TaxID=2932181 RepID=A0ABM8B8P1_9BIFI|nr:6-phospho-beta-glucosidase [Bombiscardovia nodaiensis]